MGKGVDVLEVCEIRNVPINFGILVSKYYISDYYDNGILILYNET